MLTPKFRKSPAAERIRRLLHTCVGSLKIPRKGGRHVLSNKPSEPHGLVPRGFFAPGAFRRGGKEGAGARRGGLSDCARKGNIWTKRGRCVLPL